MTPSHLPFAPRFVATLALLAAAASGSRAAHAQVAPSPEPPPPTQTFATPPGQHDAGDLKGAGPLLLPPPPPPAPPAVVAQPEPPYEPPPPRPVPEYDDPSWSFEGAAFTPGPRVSLSVVRLLPEKYGNATGGLIGIDVVGITDDDDESDDVLGFAGDMGLAIGVNGDGNIPFDAHFGMGFGLILGPLRLAPIAGVGADTLGGGDGGFSMNGAFYWLVEGRARLGFEGLGFEGFGGRAFRGNISGDRALDVPRETRAAIQAFTVLDDDDELFFGASFTDFGEARAFGAFVGYGANRE